MIWTLNNLKSSLQKINNGHFKAILDILDALSSFKSREHDEKNREHFLALGFDSSENRGEELELSSENNPLS